MAKNFYNVLGVSRDATEKDIRQAYRRMARKYHPDVNPDNKDAESKFKEINEAYQTLSNADSRRNYDAYGDNWRYADQIRHQRSSGSPFARSNRGSGGQGSRRSATFSWGTNDLGDLGDLFGGMFGSEARTHTQARDVFKPQVHEVPVTINLEEAYKGATRLVDLPPDSFGAGKGRRIEVTIPAGVDSDSKVRISVPAKGASGKMDLSLAITIAAHAQFERKGNDLYVTEQVPLVEAVLGGEIKVTTIKGTQIALSAPPETQNGRTFRLRGQGMPVRSVKGEFGDLFVMVKVVLPEKLSEREKELFEELADLRQS
jgi:DnaJ-class molecular chaperone